MRKLVGILLILILVISIAGCSRAPSPDDTVKSFMKALVEADYATAAKLVDSNQSFTELVNTPEEEEGKKLVEAVLAKISYQTGQSTVSGGNATVPLSITAPDLAQIVGLVIIEVMPTVIALAFSGATSQEQVDTLFMASFMKHINDPSAPQLKSDISVQLVKKDNIWLIAPDDALINAITGNLQTAWAELGR